MPGRPTNMDNVGQGLFALAVGAGGGRFDISPVYLFSLLSLSPGEGPI